MENRFLFRAWDKEIKSMIFDAEFLPFFTIGNINIDDKYILLQCTGLKDKNGKLIYEGDIVKLSGNDNPYMNNTIGVVKYSQEYAIFFINILNNIAWYEFCEVNQKELKIIGNIYENKELLEEK